MEEERQLLNDLAQRVGIDYLSDLHTPQFLALAVEAALALEPGKYPLSQWQDVADYLLDWEVPLRSEAEARSLLAKKAAKVKRKK